MRNTMQYKGYVGSVEFSEEDRLFFGKVLGIRSVISYDGKNAQELVEDFHGAVDDYLAMCAAEGITPEKAYKGSFNVRISAEMHKQAAICALQNNISLNKIVEQALKRFLLCGKIKYMKNRYRCMIFGQVYYVRMRRKKLRRLTYNYNIIML